MLCGDLEGWDVVGKGRLKREGIHVNIRNEYNSVKQLYSNLKKRNSQGLGNTII